MALFDLSKLLLQLEQTQQASPEALRFLMTEPNIEPALFAAADRVRRQHYGTAVYLRGLIEFTNYCKNDCYYCGIRASNTAVKRYRLDEDTIL